MSSKRPRESPPTALSIGVDLGGTHVLAVLMDEEGTIYSRHTNHLESEHRGSQAHIGGAIGESIYNVFLYAKDRCPESLPIKGVGIAVPGNVDPKRGLARYLPNFGWLTPVDLATLVLDRLYEGASLRTHLRVDRLDMRNDGRCAALAERHFGIGKGGEHSYIAMLTLGTGIGGALLHDPSPSRIGSIFDGSTFDAGDFGHHVMRSGGGAFKCVCGNYGCFECHAKGIWLM